MTPHRSSCWIVTTLFACTSTAAFAGNESRADAFALSDGLFEVVADFSENAIYWCGAGTFALSQGQGSATQKVYVWAAPAPSKARPGETAVTFGFSPPPGNSAGGGFTNDVDKVGNSMSVSQARQTCNERTSSG